MGSVGFIYIPNACKNGNLQCRLHIAFHGCLQVSYFVNRHCDITFVVDRVKKIYKTRLQDTLATMIMPN